MSLRRFALRACAAAGALLSAAGLAGAQAVEAVVLLKTKATATVPGGGRASAVGVLLPGGTMNTGIQVKVVKGTKLAPNLLIPEVVLVYPDGTRKTQADLLAAGAKVKASATSVNVTKIPELPLTGLYKVVVTGAAGLDGKPTAGACTVKVAAKTPTGFKAIAGSISSGQPTDNYTVKVPEFGILAVTVKPAKLTPFGVTLKILSSAGDEIDYSGFVKIGKDDSITVKNLPLPFFGDYTLRVGAAGGFGDYTILAKVKGKKPKPLLDLPVADAPDLLILEAGAAGLLNGSGSTGATTYRWAQVTGAPLSITNNKIAAPAVTAPGTRGTYGWQLVAFNGVGKSLPALVVLEVDRAPVASAGAGAVVGMGDATTLDGSTSLDLDTADILYYSWEQVSGPAAALDDAFSAQPTFTPASAGTYVFRLTVHDGTATSTDTVIVGAGGAAPASDAGRPVLVRLQDSVFLSGLRSRAGSGGPPTAWAWTADSENTVAVTLSNANGPVASFTAPKQSVRLRFRLAVDGSAASASDEVLVVVTTAVLVNASPVARAGAAQTVAQGEHFTLDGSASTDDGGALSVHEWLQTAGVDAGLSPSGATAAGDAPNADDVLRFLLMVHDGRKYGAPDGTAVVSGAADVPVADAGTDKTGGPGAVLTLSGTASTPSQGETLTGYTWTQVSGQDWYDVAAEDGDWDPTDATPQITVPSNMASLTPNRALSFSLVVDDPTGSSAPDYVIVNFTNLPKNSTPEVTASASGNAFRPGAAVTLYASASDPDGDPLTYQWAQVGGPTVAITGATTSQATFNTPTHTGNLTFQVTVNDGTGEPNASSLDQTVTAVNEPPEVLATATPEAGPGSTVVTLDGTGSTDPTGETLTFHWVQTPPLVGGSVTLSNPDAATCTFTQPASWPNNTAKANRQRLFTLEVVDGMGSDYKTTATVIFTPNRKPVLGAITAAGDRKLKYDNSDSETFTASPSSDLDGDTLTFSWRMVSGPSGNPSPPNTYLSSTSGTSTSIRVPPPTSTTPGTGGVYKVGVKGSDGIELSDEVTMEVVAYPSFQSHLMPIFTASCNTSACHGGGAGGLVMNSNATTTFNNLVPNQNGTSGSCSGGKRVIRDNYLGSCLYNLVNSGAMPQTGGALSTHLKNMIRDWIEPEHDASPKPLITIGGEFN